METDESPPAVDPQATNDDEDETRRKFREALARKRGRDHLGGTGNTTAQHPHAAPAKRSRTFRRKSG
ncbi:MAG TPA: DUF5302 domain-containing protein [Pseudonocardiaceae bacterium]|jgi:hypothetical protein